MYIYTCILYIYMCKYCIVLLLKKHHIQSPISLDSLQVILACVIITGVLGEGVMLMEWLNRLKGTINPFLFINSKLSFILIYFTCNFFFFSYYTFYLLHILLIYLVGYVVSIIVLVFIIVLAFMAVR